MPTEDDREAAEIATTYARDKRPLTHRNAEGRLFAAQRHDTPAWRRRTPSDIVRICADCEANPVSTRDNNSASRCISGCGNKPYLGPWFRVDEYGTPTQEH